MVKLDRSRPFGEVIGHGCQRYEQNGKAFNGAGEEIDAQGKLVDEAPPAPTNPEPPEPTAPEATETTDSEPKTPAEPEEPTIVAARSEHRGGGYYNVFDTKGDLVGEDFKKAEAEAKVTELQENADQIAAALSDG